MHDLDILDKHILLIPNLTVSALIGITAENEETGERITGDTWLTTREGPYYVDMPEGRWNIRNKGELSFKVVFGSVGTFHDLELLDTLSFLSKLTVQTIRSSERL